MMELPEAATLARQLEQPFVGKTVATVRRGETPHKFAFFSGDPAEYQAILAGKRLESTAYLGGFVRLGFGAAHMLLLGDGVGVRYLAPGMPPPAKYQLLITFADGAALACTVQMYGGMWVAHPDTYDSPYYRAAMEKPDPLGAGFDAAWFEKLLGAAKSSLSIKAFLATEQRIPGLGNGMLQDICFCANIHPKAKLADLSSGKLEALYQNTLSLLRKAAEKGGRNTEKDLYGNLGGYWSILNAKTAKNPCPVCGGAITKQTYLGGSIYFCPVCQPL